MQFLLLMAGDFSLYSIFWSAFLLPKVCSINIFFPFWGKVGIPYLMLCLSLFSFFSTLLPLIYFPFFFPWYFIKLFIFSFPLSGLRGSVMWSWVENWSKSGRQRMSGEKCRWRGRKERADIGCRVTPSLKEYCQYKVTPHMVSFLGRKMKTLTQRNKGILRAGKINLWDARIILEFFAY